MQHDIALVDHIIDLLEKGFTVSKLEALYDTVVLERAATDFVKTQRQHRLQVGLQLLTPGGRRRQELLSDHVFVDALIAALDDEPDEMLIDQIMMTPLTDPVVLSSGFVLDRQTVLDEHGHFRLQRCPFSQQELETAVYPLVFLRSRIKSWKVDRLDNAVSVASHLLAEGKLAEVERVLAIAEGMAGELGGQTYAGTAWRLAELGRRARQFAQLTPNTESVSVSWEQFYGHRSSSPQQIPRYAGESDDSDEDNPWIMLN